MVQHHSKDTKPRILIIAFSRITSDPRVLKQIKELGSFAQLTVIGFGTAPGHDISFLPIERISHGLFYRFYRFLLLLMRKYDDFYWSDITIRYVSTLLTNRSIAADFVLANDIDTLPLIRQHYEGEKIVFDAHEYSPREREDSRLWRILFQPYYDYLFHKNLPGLRKMTTVSQGIVDEYATVYNASPLLVANACYYHELKPTPPDEHHFRMIHHGIAHPARNIETTIEMFEMLDERFTLDLMLVRMNTPYGKRLSNMIAGKKRIRIIEPVPTSSIVSTINSYDIGVFLLPPNSFNYRHALPNKFFEYLQARLAIAIGPSPEMSKIVSRYALGVVADTFAPKDLALQINSLTKEDVWAYKQASDRAASTLSFESMCASMLRSLF